MFVGRDHWPAFKVVGAAMTVGTGFLVLLTFGTTRQRREASIDPLR
jgi:hypothetical protein